MARAEANEFVEADGVWVTREIRAVVPLAEGSGAVTAGREKLRQRHFRRVEILRAPRYAAHARA